MVKPRYRLWDDNAIERISKLFTEINKTLPREIHRYIRPLEHLAYWKGTEYRSILLYVGIVLFRTVLPIDHYTLFLRIACAVRICSIDAYQKYLPLARILFNEYIEGCINLDGIDTITSNIHHLAHVVDDVENLGNLNTINAYQFENALFQMKSVLKQCNKPLQQLARRIEENKKIEIPFSFDASQFPKMSKRIVNDDGQMVFKQMEYKADVLLTDNFKDQWILLTDNTIIKFQLAFKLGQKYFIRGQPLKKTDDFFTHPFDSRNLDIFASNGECSTSRDFEIENIKAKLFCIISENNFVYLPLLHTL